MKHTYFLSNPLQPSPTINQIHIILCLTEKMDDSDTDKSAANKDNINNIGNNDTPGLTPTSKLISIHSCTV